MKKKVKIGIGIFFGLFSSLTLFLFWAGYLMSIEDFHGGYEEVYYSSKNGDLIILIDEKGDYKRFGTIERKDWKAFIIPAGSTTRLNIYEWANLKYQTYFIEIYRAGFFQNAPPIPEDLTEVKQLILDKKVHCKRRLKYDW